MGFMDDVKDKAEDEMHDPNNRQKVEDMMKDPQTREKIQQIADEKGISFDEAKDLFVKKKDDEQS